MSANKEKSLHRRFAIASKVKQEPGTFPRTSHIEALYPEVQAELLSYAEGLQEQINDHVTMMERVKDTVNDAWRNTWGPQYREPVMEYTLDVPATALPYWLTQFEGYKKAHEICGRKDVNVCVELKQVERKFINTETYWAVVVDISKPYSASPDAALFKKLARDEKKSAKPAV